jgi:CRP/FNR family transcriptional regulator
MLRTATETKPVMFVPAMIKKAAATKPGIACSACCLHGVCLPGGLSACDLDRFDELVATKRRVVRGVSLYRDGDAFEYLYAVRSGAFKTVGVSRHGDEKITGFHLAGELLGLEAISSGKHAYDAVALEDSEVCAMPFAALEKLSLAVPALQHQLFRALSGDISRDQGLMLLLGSMTAEQRLAAFLLSLSRRYQSLGFAADRFNLRMTREEIGNYLGLTLETVSRLFSRFQREGMLMVRHREVELRKAGRLREIVG